MTSQHAAGLQSLIYMWTGYSMRFGLMFSKQALLLARFNAGAPVEYWD